MSDAENRSLVYRLLSRLFCYPQEKKDLLGGLREDGSCLTRLLAEGDPNPRLAGLQESIRRSRLQDLQVDYVRLFDYRPLCPPYESAYVSDRQRQQVARDLGDLYRESGLQCREGAALDHIVVQLEFMQYLSAREGAEVDNPRWVELQRTFLRDHLLNWVPRFSDSLVENAAEPYRGLGSLLHVITQREEKQLALSGESSV